MSACDVPALDARSSSLDVPGIDDGASEVFAGDIADQLKHVALPQYERASAVATRNARAAANRGSAVHAHGGRAVRASRPVRLASGPWSSQDCTRVPIAPSPKFGVPRFPFTGWPEQIVDPRLGYIWFVAPNVCINQAHVRRADVAAAEAVHDWIDRALAAEPKAIANAGGLIVLHDWRTLDGYDGEARRVFVERMRSRPKGYLKTAYAIIPSTPLFRMAIQAANLAAALGAGGRIELATDPEPILRRLAVSPPREGTPFPGAPPAIR